MNERRPKEDGFGYAVTPFRVEHRPTYGPHTREELTEMLDILQENGVKAWWYAVSSKGSYPLFKSNYLPYRDDAVDYFPWLVEEAHSRGIALFSWEYLSTAPLVGAQHPEWRWRFFDWEGPGNERDKHYVCYNSPYGELMKEFTLEVVKDLGIDGVWFDGSFLLGNGATGQYACCCDYCAEKYRKETGRSIPETIDFRDTAFCEFIEWRYHDHTEYWRRLSSYVREHCPEAIVVYNYFNRINKGTVSGSPLRRMAGDAPEGPDSSVRPPMEGMITAERGKWPQQVPLMIKTLNAINDNYPVEVWAPATDCVTHNGPIANPINLIFHGETCATFGGYGSYGFGGGTMKEYAPVLKALSTALDPVAPWVGGQKERLIGLVLSGTTKDYAFISADGKSNDSTPVWQSVHGMHGILNALHLPSDVLLDNMLNRSFLDQYEAVVLPGVECIDGAAVNALTEYVENGGTLLAMGDTGMRTQFGQPRETGALDELFGIEWRDENPVCANLRIHPNFLDDAFAPGIEKLHNVLDFEHTAEDRVRVCGEGRLVQSDIAEVLAEGSYIPGGGTKRFGAKGLIPPDASRAISGAAIISRRIGKGFAAYVAPDLARSYARFGPSRLSREIVARLLLHRISPPFSTDAPANVSVTCWQQERRLAFHLLNVPSSLLLFPGGGNPAFPTLPEDFIPTGPISIEVEGSWSKAYSPLNAKRVSYAKNDGRLQVSLNRLDRHDVVVVEKS